MSPFIKDERVRHIKALVRSGVASSGAVEIIDSTVEFPRLTLSSTPSKERAWPILPVVKVGPLTRVPLFVPAESLALPSNFQWATRLVVGASWARIGSNSPERFATNIVPAKTPTARPIASQACHERTRAF